MAQAASTTGAARVTMQGSCRPWMDSGSTLPVRMLSVC